MDQEQASHWRQNDFGAGVSRNVAGRTRTITVESSEGDVVRLQAALTDTVADLRERTLEALGRQIEDAQRYAIGTLSQQGAQQFQSLEENTTVEDLVGKDLGLCLYIIKVPSYGP